MVCYNPHRVVFHPLPGFFSLLMLVFDETLGISPHTLPDLGRVPIPSQKVILYRDIGKNPGFLGYILKDPWGKETNIQKTRL